MEKSWNDSFAHLSLVAPGLYASKAGILPFLLPYSCVKERVTRSRHTINNWWQNESIQQSRSWVPTGRSLIWFLCWIRKKSPVFFFACCMPAWPVYSCGFPNSQTMRHCLKLHCSVFWSILLPALLAVTPRSAFYASCCDSLLSLNLCLHLPQRS